MCKDIIVGYPPHMGLQYHTRDGAYSLSKSPCMIINELLQCPWILSNAHAMGSREYSSIMTLMTQASADTRKGSSPLSILWAAV